MTWLLFEAARAELELREAAWRLGGFALREVLLPAGDLLPGPARAALRELVRREEAVWCADECEAPWNRGGRWLSPLEAREDMPGRRCRLLSGDLVCYLPRDREPGMAPGTVLAVMQDEEGEHGGRVLRLCGPGGERWTLWREDVAPVSWGSAGQAGEDALRALRRLGIFPFRRVCAVVEQRDG